MRSNPRTASRAFRLRERLRAGKTIRDVERKFLAEYDRDVKGAREPAPITSRVLPPPIEVPPTPAGEGHAPEAGAATPGTAPPPDPVASADSEGDSGAAPAGAGPPPLDVPPPPGADAPPPPPDPGSTGFAEVEQVVGLACHVLRQASESVAASGGIALSDEFIERGFRPAATRRLTKKASEWLANTTQDERDDYLVLGSGVFVGGQFLWFKLTGEAPAAQATPAPAPSAPAPAPPPPRPPPPPPPPASRPGALALGE